MHSAQSSVNFIYNLVEAREGAYGDFSLKQGRPLSGQTEFIYINSIYMTDDELFFRSSRWQCQHHGLSDRK